MYPAHIVFKDGNKITQTVVQHSLETAAYAFEKLKPFKFGSLAYAAGLIHDMGKFTSNYKQYIEDTVSGKPTVRGSVNHTFAGVIYMMETYHDNTSDQAVRLAAELIAYAAGAHHGLFDALDLDGKNGFLYRVEKDREVIAYNEAKRAFFQETITEEEFRKIFFKAVDETREFITKLQSSDMSFGLCKANLTRIILSAVIYGDWKSTREFMKQTKDPEYHTSWENTRKEVEEKLKMFPSDTAINRIRQNISRQCAEKASSSSGIYRLHVPTGGGKTYSALRYSLKHASINGKKRIINVIPLLSILDQNAKEIKEIMPENVRILEHHSDAVSRIKEDEEDLYKYLTDTWDVPFVVTTLVRLLETFFGNKTADIGRLCSVCGSVIVIDEIQNLPIKSTLMANSMMNFLSVFCGTTFVLSSATQPEFEDTKEPIMFAHDPDIVSLSKNQLSVFDRADIINNTALPIDIEALADLSTEIMEKRFSCLMIVNTKKQAKELYKRICENTKGKKVSVFLLYDWECGKHRKDILDIITKKLKQVQKNYGREDQEKIICVSTVLVEAGIDFSWDTVIRTLGGISNLIQSLGRCNRSGEYPVRGQMYIVRMKNNEEYLPEEMDAAKSAAQGICCVKTGKDLTSEQAVNIYYKRMFGTLSKKIGYPVIYKNVSASLYDLMKKGSFAANSWEEYELRQPFKYIASEYKVFDEDKTPVIVPYGDGKNIIETLEKLDTTCYDVDFFDEMKKLTKKLTDYTVTLFDSQVEQGLAKKKIRPIHGGHFYVVNDESYDQKTGIII